MHLKSAISQKNYLKKTHKNNPILTFKIISLQQF